MKECPACHQPFAYDLLKFCRFDGSRLVNATPEEATTMLLPASQKSNRKVEVGVDLSANGTSSPRITRV